MTPGPEKNTSEATRRDFLKTTAGGVSGAVIVIGTAGAFPGEQGEGAQDKAAKDPKAAQGARPAQDQQAGAEGKAPSPESQLPPYDASKHRYAFLMDITKCIGCGSCVRACEAENDVPKGYFRTWIERYTVSRSGHVEVDSPNGGHDAFEPVSVDRDITKSFFVPKICNHCTETPCVQLCPVGASYRSLDGLILVDEKRCIGCGYCVQACPYGSRFMHPKTHTASKCTLCYHRITRGLPTACEQVCPTGARKLGDLKKPGDEVAETLATERVMVVKPELLTEPNCYYLGMSSEVR